MGKKLVTKIIHTGSSPEKNSGSINIPVYKNSTLIFNNYNTFLNAKKSRFDLPYYGRINTKTTSNWRNKEELSSFLKKKNITGTELPLKEIPQIIYGMNIILMNIYLKF